MPDELAVVHLSGAETTSRPWEQLIAELADAQHGVVARHQLLEMGMGRRAIGGRLAKGALHPVHRGVYAVGRTGLSRKGEWMAAVLAGGRAAVLSHRPAGKLWGLLGGGVGPLEITRPAGLRSRCSGIVGHQANLSAGEIKLLDRIPVTSPFRTVFDLAAVLSRRQLERAMNEADVHGLVDGVSLPQLLDRHPGHRGAANLRTLLGTSDPGGVTRNDFEEAFVALLDASGLPRPRLNADLALRGRFYEVDCLWQAQRVAVELDGHAVHGTRRAFEADRERDRVLLAEGWRPMRVTWRQLQDEPEVIVSDLRRLLGSRAVI